MACRLSLIFLLLLSALARAQTVRITEILPENTAGLMDADGTFQGWVELWNTSTTAKTVLSGARLTDGTTTWTFPGAATPTTSIQAEIEPDGRMVVFLSGKNRVVPTAPFHTNFASSATGGVIELRNSANTLISSLPYPDLPANVSWGRDEADTAVTPALVGRYDSPTPGERNNYSGTGVAGNVMISPTSGAFIGTMQVTLSLPVSDPDTVIRYTTNGALPTATSTLYTAPFNVTTTQRIRARAFKTGLLPGETETEAYLLLSTTTQNFSSAMPLAVISNFSTAQPPDTGDQEAYLWVWYPATPDNRSRFTNPPDLATRVVIDKRGSSTLGNAKFNLNVEFRKERDNDDRDLPLMGMPAHSDWVFHAPYAFDPSLLHNPLAYAMSNAIGRWASRNRMAEVFVDVTGTSLSFSGSASGDYFGVYNVLEKIRRGNDRLDVKKLDTYDNDAVSKTGGYIFKIDRQDSGDTGVNAGGQTWAYYYPKEIEIKSPHRDPQEQALTAHLNGMQTALTSAAYKDPVTGYAAWIDVPGAIDHHLINVWTFNVDALRLSGYWHKERSGKIVPGPVWDFDRTMSSTDVRDDNPAIWRSTNPSDMGTDFFNYPWWNRMFTDPDFYQKYVDRWQEVRRGALSRANLEAMITALNAEISAEAATRDLARWGQAKRIWTRPAGADFLPAGTFTGQAAEVQRLKDYMQQRANFMDSQWVAPVTTSIPAGAVAPGTQVFLTGPASSVIYYTLDGSDPRPSGGAVPAAANVFTYSGTPITVNAATSIRARAYKATHTALTGANNPSLVCKWSGITRALYTTTRTPVPGDLAITELNYNPVAPTPAELTAIPAVQDNDFEFVEIRNNAADAVQLAGVQLSDAVTWQFPADQDLVLPAGGYLIVVSNPAAFMLRYPAFTGALHGPWTGNLSNGGELIRLLSPALAPLFSMTWDDEWSAASDGSGATLAVYNPGSPAVAFSTPENWRASAAPGGSPGSAEPNLPPVVTTPASLEGRADGIAISGTVRDDGQPLVAAPSSVLWSKVSGPGTVTFMDATASSTTATFSHPGVYVLRLEATDSALTGQSEITVNVSDTFGLWLARNPGGISATADPDGDGLNTLAEFVFGSDPTVPGAAPLPISLENGQPTVTLHRTKGNYTMKVQTSPDLRSWQTAAAGDFTIRKTAETAETETLKYSFLGSAQVKFVRFEFTLAR